MKLTEEDTYVDVFTGVIPNKIFLVKIYCKDMEIGKQLKQQILENQEKAEKWDTYGSLESYKRLGKVDQENKQLKETLEHFQNEPNWVENTKEFSKIFHKNEELEQRVKDLESKPDHEHMMNYYKEESDNLKQKLEKIEKIYKNSPPYDQNLGIKLKEILENKLPSTVSRPMRDEGMKESKND